MTLREFPSVFELVERVEKLEARVDKEYILGRIKATEKALKVVRDTAARTLDEIVRELQTEIDILRAML